MHAAIARLLRSPDLPRAGLGSPQCRDMSWGERSRVGGKLGSHKGNLVHIPLLLTTPSGGFPGEPGRPYAMPNININMHAAS